MTNPADTPLPLPQSGGSYIRLADGSLVLEGPEVAQPEPAKPGVKAPVKTPVKEA